MSVKLLEYLQKQCGCEYLSDLSASSLSRNFPCELTEALWVIDADRWTCEEWNEAIHYMFPNVSPAESAEGACILLMQKCLKKCVQKCRKNKCADEVASKLNFKTNHAKIALGRQVGSSKEDGHGQKQRLDKHGTD